MQAQHCPQTVALPVYQLLQQRRNKLQKILAVSSDAGCQWLRVPLKKLFPVRCILQCWKKTSSNLYPNQLLQI